MATSINNAQIPLSCQLCCLLAEIKWKCIECELLMCDNCKTNVHSRIKTANKHKIITILQIGDDLSDRLKALHISEVFSSVFNTYSSDLKGIHKLICCDDDIIYLMSSTDLSCHFIKAELLKSSIKTLQKMDIECVDFAISSKEKILFSPEPRNKLFAASTNKKKVKTVLNMSPLVIVAIHMSEHAELLISLREKGPHFPVTDISTRQVAVFGTDYKHKATFERDVTGKRLFNFTRRIKTDSKNNIYVLDWYDVDQRIGQIVSMDMSGQKRFVYNGCAAFNTHEAAFNPEDIAVTSQDTTIISDNSNHALHVLNINGELIGLQITKNSNILYPCSLSIDNHIFLLIGCSTDYAKIHVVKLLL